MRQKTRLGWVGSALVAVAGCVGLVFAVDQFFKAEVAGPVSAGRTTVTVANNGFLKSRRAVHLVCAAGKARVMTKARFVERSFIAEGAKTEGEIHVVEWHNRGRAQTILKVPMTVGKGWIDTLETDDLPGETLVSLIDALRDPAKDFIAVSAFEHGFYFRRPASPVSLSRLNDCLPH